MCIGVCVVNCLAYHTSHVKCELRDLCDIWGLAWCDWFWFDIGKVMIFVIQKNLMMIIGGILWCCCWKTFLIATSFIILLLQRISMILVLNYDFLKEEVLYDFVSYLSIKYVVDFVSKGVLWFHYWVVIESFKILLSKGFLRFSYWIMKRGDYEITIGCEMKISRFYYWKCFTFDLKF